MTVAYVLLIAERVAEAQDSPWPAFAGRNPDLLARDPSPLARFYTPELLASDRARRGFVMPDRSVATHAARSIAASGEFDERGGVATSGQASHVRIRPGEADARTS
jgi:hypothetical protein